MTATDFAALLHAALVVEPRRACLRLVRPLAVMEAAASAALGLEARR